jgi:hypothetical protein
MQAVTTIGLDIAKSVFQVHGIDASKRTGSPLLSLWRLLGPGLVTGAADDPSGKVDAFARR